jgi:hypothetical protein
VLLKAADIQEAISEGSVSFLVTEYKYMGVFMVRPPAMRHAAGSSALLAAACRLAAQPSCLSRPRQPASQPARPGQARRQRATD